MGSIELSLEHGALDDATMRLLMDAGCTVTPCGSRYTQQPPPTDTDADWLVYCPSQDNVSQLWGALGDLGWEWEGDSEHYQRVADSGFTSWRRGDQNLIVTANAEFWRRHRTATHVCRELNEPDKARRVMVFQAILYDRHGRVEEVRADLEASARRKAEREGAK